MLLVGIFCKKKGSQGRFQFGLGFSFSCVGQEKIFTVRLALISSRPGLAIVKKQMPGTLIRKL